MSLLWRCREVLFDLEHRVLVMGILNATPDSFSDGGRHAGAQAAIEHGVRLAAEGADIIDVGGESTRPGAEPVSPQEELARVIPVIEGLRARIATPISIDTLKAEVARQALAAGAQIINDVTALRGDAAMAPLAAASGAGVVLMHMLGEPRTMQKDPQYGDVIEDICDFLKERMESAQIAEIAPEQLVLDPGIGFGKKLEHNIQILRRLGEFACLDRPLLVGPSRKAFIGALLGGVPVDQRLEGTAAAVAASILGGARIVRVHDVQPLARVAKVAAALAGISA